MVEVERIELPYDTQLTPTNFLLSLEYFRLYNWPSLYRHSLLLERPQQLYPHKGDFYRYRETDILNTSDHNALSARGITTRYVAKDILYIKLTSYNIGTHTL